MREGMNNSIKKGVVVSVILLFVSVSVIPSTGTAVEKKSAMSFDGNTLYVGGLGPSNYTTIQAAIDDADNGDTVFVYDDSSPYYENVVVDKSINLIGEDRDTTVIDGSNSGSVVQITTNDVVLNCFTIQNSGNEKMNYSGIAVCSGIEVWDCDYNIISDNIIRSNQAGIVLVVTYYSNITNNIITSNQYGIIGTGIRMYGEGRQNIISGNIISHNEYGIYGVYGFDSSIISNNTIMNNRYGLEFASGAYHNICMRNNISNNLVGINTHQSGTITNQNNFIKNIRHAKYYNLLFLTIDEIVKNIWNENYWGKPRETPYLIPGRIFGLFPWFPQFDWNPALKPYDIDGGDSISVERNVHCREGVGGYVK